MSILGRLFGGRRRDRLDQAERIIKAIARVVEGAADLREARARVAKGAEEGDLDDVISWAHERDARVKDFLKGK